MAVETPAICSDLNTQSNRIPGNSFAFTYSILTADADPGDGTIRLSNSSPASTTTLYVDLSDVNGSDLTAWLTALTTSTSSTKGIIHLYSKADPTNFVVYRLTAITTATGYRKLTVTYVTSNGSLSTTPGDTVFDFTYTGDQGDLTSNTAVSVDGELALFNSTSGKQIKRATLTGVPLLAAGVLSATAARENDVAGPYTSVNAATTLIYGTHKTVNVDASGGSRTITLPTAVGHAGQGFMIRKSDSSTNTVPIATTTSQTIDGHASADTTLTLFYQGSSITVISDGANWIIANRGRSLQINWTPTMDSTGTAMTIGTGPTQTGHIVEDGEYYEMKFYIVLGTAPTVGTGNYHIIMPVNVFGQTGVDPVGFGTYYDSSTANRYPFVMELDSSNTKATMAFQGAAPLGAASPVIPAVGDAYRGVIRTRKA